ncbi:MAG: heavy-metal-associated domain-containing protein [Bacteroidia bacterium]
MKTKITTWLCCMIFSIATFARTETKTETFTVYGNCSMCKATIEGALKKKDGIISKNWDKEKKIITVTYDPAKINILQIGEKIAAVGYDNQYATAQIVAYNNLHECCQYERPKQNK